MGVSVDGLMSGRIPYDASELKALLEAIKPESETGEGRLTGFYKTR
jgi:hypothetical protein